MTSTDADETSPVSPPETFCLPWRFGWWKIRR